MKSQYGQRLFICPVHLHLVCLAVKVFRFCRVEEIRFSIELSITIAFEQGGFALYLDLKQVPVVFQAFFHSEAVDEWLQVEFYSTYSISDSSNFYAPKYGFQLSDSVQNFIHDQIMAST